MEWRDTNEEADFRKEVKSFIEKRFPKGYKPDLESEQSLEPEDVYGYNWAADRRSNDPKRRNGAAEWAALLAERGWIAPSWPREYGGAELSVTEEFILQEEMMRAGVPTVNGIGVALLGPTLLEFGSTEQKRRHLPAIARGEETWAQGFSEQSSGSDLASLQTRAELEGDHYVVNGRKVWTSLAQFADWLFVLVRTDPDARKHRGISFLLIEANAPGVKIRPIEDMRGAEPFASLSFDDVRVPVTNRVGEENRGFYIAMATLAYERSGIGASVKYEQLLERLISTVAPAGGQAATERVRPDWGGAIRHEIAQRFIEVRVLRDLALNTLSTQGAGEVSGYEASVNQLFSAELHQRLARTGGKVFGMHSGLWQREGAPLRGAFTHDSFDAVANTLLGGTAEIQRNVIATRGLGLPKE